MNLNRHSPRSLAGNLWVDVALVWIPRQWLRGMTLCAVLCLPLSASPSKVLLSTTTLLPGETLRIEVDGSVSSTKMKAMFNGKAYPFFVVGPSAQRALIGVKLDTKPGSYPLTFKVPQIEAVTVRGLPEETYTIVVATKVFTIENVNFAPEKKTLMSSEHMESSIIHKANAYLSRDQQWESTFVYPVDGKEIGEFGLKRMRNGTIDAGFHKGIDLRADKGTPVRAANAGTVVLARNFKAHGKTVMINHGQGVMTIYLHLSAITVNVREKVQKGQTIGKVGSTGLSTAPHVHFQVFVHGVPVDPKPWVEGEF